MAEKKGLFKRSFGAMFNIPRWIAWGSIVASTKIVWEIGRDLFVNPAKSVIPETFEEAAQRLNLTEEDIKQRQKTFLHNAIAFLVISIILLTYTIYLLVNSYWLATFVGSLLTALILVYAYREHFWYTQIKYRKLGLDFKTWRQLLFKKRMMV
jgi:intracellular multiplication protein IcmV